MIIDFAVQNYNKKMIQTNKLVTKLLVIKLLQA